MPTIHLVRHGQSLVDRSVPAHEWELDPDGFDDVWALRQSGRLPSAGAWFSSPEPKAVQTAQLLTDREVSVVGALREHRRESTAWHPDFPAVVRRAFAEPGRSAAPGWEPLDACRERVAGAVRGLVQQLGEQPLVLVGHGTAWTLLASELTGSPPDLRRWESLGMPDVITVESLPETGRPGP